MKRELYLFILWENVRKHEKLILKDLNDNFDVIQTLEVVWDRKTFSKNLSKFYGTKLEVNIKRNFIETAKHTIE